MKITVDGPVTVTTENEDLVSAPELLSKFDKYESTETFLDYLTQPLSDLALQGGKIQLKWDPDTQSLGVQTIFHCFRALSDTELDTLKSQTMGQWSDGLGEGCFDDETMLFDLLPDVSNSSVKILQLDDGIKIKAPRIHPLVSAVKKGNQDALERVLKKDVNVNARSKTGQTVLHLAIINRNASIAMTLLASGANPRLADLSGNKPIHAVAQWGSLKVLLALLKQGASTDATDQRGATALMWAANRGHIDAVEALLEAGANPNAQDTLEDNEGCTPLMYVTPSKPEIVDRLLQAGADPNIRNESGQSATEYHANQLEYLRNSPHSDPQSISQLETLIHRLKTSST